MRPNLLIARVGDHSLHSRWMVGPRNFDLALSCFGQAPPAHTEECVAVEYVKGPKWQPVHDFLQERKSLVQTYGYVAIADDDLLFSGPILSQFFDLCRAHDLALAQPSLDYASYYSHPITVRRQLLTLRYTNFVEAMIPCFRVDVLYDLLETFSASRSGWGLDCIWSEQVARDGGKIAIVDAVSVTHTRPVGGELYRNGSLGHSPFDDLDAISRDGRANIKPDVHRAIAFQGIPVSRAIVKGLGLLTRFQRRRDGAAKWVSRAL